jgi:hypothetical protein
VKVEAVARILCRKRMFAACGEVVNCGAVRLS